MAINSKQNEVWKDVAGYEGLYEVSTNGRVRRNGHIRKTRVDYRGYEAISLYKCSKGRNFKIHRLVASAFIENPENKRTVNHKDGNKLNNNVENLEWATHSENLIHASKIGLRPVSDNQRKAASITGRRTCELNRPKKPVFCIKNGQVEIFESAHSGARFVNGNPSAVVACCKGRKKTYKGYEWGYC